MYAYFNMPFTNKPFKKAEIIDYTKQPMIDMVSGIAKKVLRYKKSGSVLDVGTGTGRNALFLAKSGFKVTALDSVKSKIEALKKEARKREVKLNYIKANIASFKPFKKYDVILANMSLHFLKESQVSKTIKKLQDYTKKNGLNLIAVHTDRNPKSHYRPYLFKRNELKNYYRGWKIVKYNEGLGMPFRLKPRGKVIRRYGAGIVARKN
jgi:tellurite methyltransferase